MKLTVEIELGNDAMQTNTDALALLQRAWHSRGGGSVRFKVGDGGKFLDSNGNSVGYWKVKNDGAD